MVIVWLAIMVLMMILIRWHGTRAGMLRIGDLLLWKVEETEGRQRKDRDYADDDKGKPQRWLT